MHYIKDYRLTLPTGIGFPGEASGLIPPLSQWSGTTLPTVSFGQGIAVTAVQMAAAYNTIANGGLYVPPRLVKATIGPHGHEHPVAAGAPHRVVAKKVAKEMIPMFEQVVAAGTGINAQVPPYAVAGKTGTAYIRNPAGGYNRAWFNSSFAGFAPAQHPAVTVMVVMEHTKDYGAQASAPAFSVITRAALEDLKVPPQGRQPPAAKTASPTPLTGG
jgi:cell division protein FtsI (penicillin-binding protein 3)